MPVPVASARAAPATAARRRPTPIGDAVVMALAVVLSAGSIGWFAWSGRPVLVPLHFSAAAALWWNALLSLVFFAQHSIMIRRSVRDRLAAVIPDRYDLAFYAITSSIVLATITALFQRVEAPPVWELHGVARLLVMTAAASALALIIWSVLALRTFDPCGLRPIRASLRAGATVAPPALPFRAKAKEFVIRGPFRWVRHPLYLAIIVLFWASPRMPLSRLELAVLWTAWTLVATLLEENDLRRDYGDEYRRYCARVPMLLPRRRPVPTRG